MGLWVGVVFLAMWARWPVPWLLVGAAAGVVAWLPPGRPRGLPGTVAILMVLAGVLGGFLAHHQLVGLATRWPEIREARETEVAERLRLALDALVEAGDAATARLAEAAAEGPAAPGGASLRRIRARSGLAAMALYGPDGELQVWDGVHRGPVPPAVRLGSSAYEYGERPLFSYFYFTAPVAATGATAMAAALLRADLPPPLEGRPEDFVSRFERRVGERIVLGRAERAAEQGVWDFRWEDRALFSVSIQQATQAERRDEILRGWGRVLGALVLAAWLLSSVAGRERPELRRGSAVALLGVSFVFPLSVLATAGGPFPAADFLLPGPLEVTLGRLLTVAAAGAVVVGLLSPGRVRLGPLLGAALPVALGFPLLVAVYRRGASADFLAVGGARWIAFQVGLALLLASLAALAVRVGRPREGAAAPALATAALALACGLAAVAGLWARMAPGLPSGVLAAWGVPAALMTVGLGSASGWRRTFLSWAAGAVLGATAALPAAWDARITARMHVAEAQLERLGTRADPYLEFLLHRLGGAVDSLASAGAGPVEILYGGWASSGLAGEGHPLWLTLWSPGGLPQEELHIGVTSPRPPVADEVLARSRESSGPYVRRYAQAEAHYAASVVLSDGSVVTAVVPPRRELRGGSPLGPFIGSVGDSGRDPLTLVPLLPGDVPDPSGSVTWVRTGGGWQGELTVAYPDATYHAHYAVDLAGPALLGARGTLVLALDLVLLLGFWSVGRLGTPGGRIRLREWLRHLLSFRARVTLALFGFFLLSLTIFGTLAYRTISGAAIRTATVLAERVAEDAAGWYLEVQGAMDLLARRVGADLLEYRRGALIGGSVDELVELGVYDGWLPPDVHQLLEGGEDIRTSVLSSLGRWEYVMAYRRLPDGDILASPVPLELGATAVRRREVAHLLAFAVLAGAALSLMLALLVGRTLTRPIHTLQVASERVGAGNLRVRLPSARADEFGSVFAAFNRMVARLRRARRALVRTTRRTQAIVEEAATGVVALDAAGRVTLVNPRAEALLGVGLPVGRPLPESEGAASELVRWVGLYFRDGLREAVSEFQMGERRIRVRARRISRRGPRGGAVLSLEDVTDELRTERILAWGEMAQQVAHEVKNPLTPIKLSVQHIRRAWDDRRPEFGAILSRNVEAILREIDRLAAIARGFSRFGAPRAAGELPLEPVSAREVVDEIVTLYSGGGGAIRFRCDVPAGLPPVSARASELKEVLVNLLENARAAIVQRGSVVVDAELRGEEVELRVRDTGVGIPPELMPRIFEPHFSTRSTGTGLGLPIVRRLVESWGGTVGAESRAGIGTVVRIQLRCWDGDGRRHDPGGAPQEPSL